MSHIKFKLNLQCYIKTCIKIIKLVDKFKANGVMSEKSNKWLLNKRKMPWD